MTKQSASKTPFDVFTQFSALPGADSAAAFAKNAVDAVVASQTAFADGIESLTRETLIAGRAAFQRNAAAVVSLFDAKSPEDVVGVHVALTQKAFEAAAANAQRFAALAARIAGDVAAPLSAHAAATGAAQRA